MGKHDAKHRPNTGLIASLTLKSRPFIYQHSRKIDCARGVPHATPTSDKVTVARCSLDRARNCQLTRNIAASLSELSTSCRTDGYTGYKSRHRFWTTHTSTKHMSTRPEHADPPRRVHNRTNSRITFKHRTIHVTLP